MIDLSHITTPADAEALMQAAAARYQQLQQQAADTDAARRARIGAAVQAYRDLLGTHDQPAYDPAVPGSVASIRSVRKHPPAVLAEHDGIVLSLLLEAVEIQVVNAIDVALVVGDEV